MEIYERVYYREMISLGNWPEISLIRLDLVYALHKT
jgi:hypothetical protein